MRLKGKSRAVDWEELDKIGRKARCETEAFINQHIHDRAKGWPVSCRFGPDYIGPGQVQQVRKQGKQTNKRISA